MNWGVHTLAWLWPNLAHADCGVQTKFWHRFIFAACVLLSFFSTHHENQHAISLRVFSSNQDARQLALIRCSFCDEWKRAFKGPITWSIFNPGVELSPVNRVEMFCDYMDDFNPGVETLYYTFSASIRRSKKAFILFSCNK
jgi:hypothetical protein